MNIAEIMSSGANVQIVISALDLKEAFLDWSEEIRMQLKAEKEEEKFLSAKEAALKMGVSLSTLWRWDKEGYLKKIKIGDKIRYRESDVINLMDR